MRAIYNNSTMLKKIKDIPKKLALLIIFFYQKIISPLLGNNKCRYYPSCSEYTRKSLEKHGLIKGAILGISRILRCAPYSKGGIDFPPNYFSFKEVLKKWKYDVFLKTSKDPLYPSDPPESN